MARTAMRGRRRSFSSRRKFVWARSAGTGIVAAQPGGFTRDLLEEFKARFDGDPVGMTVVRIRGEVLWNPGPVAAGQEATGVLAARVATEPFGTSEELPITISHADWFMYEPFITHSDWSEGFMHRRVIDVKANRKLEELAQGLLLAAQHTTAGVSAEVTWNLSVGLKLP